MTESGALHSLKLRDGQPLGAGAAIRLLQTRSVLGIVRALMPGPLRFLDLMAASRARSATTLQARLRELQGAGVVTHQELLYSLNPQGAALNAVLGALDQFQAAHPGVDSEALLAALQRRHAMPIMRSLIPGELGFNELQRAVGIPSATTLSRRLADLEALGLLHKTVHSAMPPRTTYRHSEVGAGFNTVIGHIVLWGEGLSPDLIGALLDDESAVTRAGKA